MIDASREMLGTMSGAYGRGGSLVLLFDYDGTLTPIVEHPRLAVLDGKTRRLLVDLASRPHVHVGIVSGRDLAELESLVGVPGLYLAGTGGLELDLRGLRIVYPGADQVTETLEAIALQLESPVTSYDGAWLERKKRGLTVHYRHMPAHLLGSLRDAVVLATSRFAGAVRIVQGPKAWELTPANAWNKGTAVRVIFADCGADDAGLLYAGDGANDTEALAEVAALGGLTLGVGPDAPSVAAYRLEDHVSLLSFLRDLDALLEGRKPDSGRPAKTARVSTASELPCC